ncbi:unnamed protein product [Amoebophrya sp. A25]|nr:unnamed protein product [Amoebophrya sp. A25]|eukprot:GSA25T00015428001.1
MASSPTAPAGGPGPSPVLSTVLRPGETPLEAASRGEEALAEAYSKMVHTLETEKQKAHQAWVLVEERYTKMEEWCEILKGQTEEWCAAERAKIADAWKEIEDTRHRLHVLTPTEDKILKINCSGEKFQIKKGALACVPDCHLNAMFGEESTLEKDDLGRFYLDFNPVCFALILDFIKNKALAEKNASPPLPLIPKEHKGNMDVLCEALKFHYFLPPNEMLLKHGTSLIVSSTVVESSVDGWQFISGQYPLRSTQRSYFEVKVERNADTKGGLAIGVCGKQPSGNDIHHLKQRLGIVYNSSNGIIDTEATAVTDGMKQVMFKEGCVVGVEYDPQKNTVSWFFNTQLIGTCGVNHAIMHEFGVVYPVFGLYAKGQKIRVDFQALPPPKISAH